MLKVYLRNYPAVRRALEGLARDMGQIQTDILEEFAEEDVVRFLRNPRNYYPRQVHRRMRIFSERQRRFFWWALRTGRIQVPYRRTYNMASAWHAGRKGKSVQVYNHSDAAFWTMHNSRQSYHHRGNWPTISDIMNERVNLLGKRAANRLDREANKRLP